MLKLGQSLTSIRSLQFNQRDHVVVAVVSRLLLKHIIWVNIALINTQFWDYFSFSQNVGFPNVPNHYSEGALYTYVYLHKAEGDLINFSSRMNRINKITKIHCEYTHSDIYWQIDKILLSRMFVIHRFLASQAVGDFRQY